MLTVLITGQEHGISLHPVNVLVVGNNSLYAVCLILRVYVSA